ncbi:MAG: hypothetical protein LBF15_04935 [Candidatus Peribacteria bacterium]|jgi:hypothetical protein|nr:hypothetical protein [Candidatus Peribacteria bacterium]
MKKLFSLILIFGGIFAVFFSQATAEEEENYFVVTAYYSPLPDQEYYFTGNYESEIRLQ